MKPKTNPVNISDNSVSLEEAMQRTNYWRQAVKVLFDYDTNAVPKGFVIPLEDIQQLADKYKALGAVGVRAYFTLEGPEFEGGVTAVLVPVTEVIGADNETVIYKDLILSAGENTVDSGSSIYDFTKPCPPSCDITSPLS